MAGVWTMNGEGKPITADNPATPTFNELTGEFRDVPDTQEAGRTIVPVDMLRAASRQMQGRKFTVREGDAVWLLLYHLFSAMGGAMAGSMDTVLVVEEPRR